MPDASTRALGLMQALAPVVSRRPVHLTISAAPTSEGHLHLVVQPIHVEGETSADLSRGFVVEGTPAELDEELPELIADRWVPAHTSLQSVVDQVASHTTAARDTTLRTAAKGGKGKGKAAGVAAGQTELAADALFIPPPAGPDADGGGAETPDAEPSPAGKGRAGGSAQEPNTSPEVATQAPAAEVPITAAPTDTVSELFD